MNAEELSKKWNHLGRTDPLWSILTSDDKKGNRWDEEEFFATLREFIRVLRAGGVAVFQLPAAFPDDWGSNRYDPEQAEKIEMYGTDKPVVLAMLDELNADVLEVEEDGACGPGFPSYRYVISKR